MLKCFKAQDPDMERFAKVSSAVRDAVTCYSRSFEVKERIAYNHRFYASLELGSQEETKSRLKITTDHLQR